MFGSVVGTVAPADAGRARAVPRLRDQQVPRRSCRSSTTACGCSRSEPASPCFGVFPYRRTICTSTPRTASRCDTRPRRAGAARRAHRDRPVPAPVERDGLPSADVGRLDRRRRRRIATTSSSCRAARTRSRICSWLRATGSGRLDRSRSIAAARRSSASAAAIRCSAERFTIRPAMESSGRAADGLGLLPVDDDARRARSGRARSPRRRPAASSSAATRFISASRRSIRTSASTPFARLDDGSGDGMRGVGRDRHVPARRVRASRRLRGGLRHRRARRCARRPTHYQRLADWFERARPPSRPSSVLS